MSKSLQFALVLCAVVAAVSLYVLASFAAADFIERRRLSFVKSDELPDELRFSKHAD